MVSIQLHMTALTKSHDELHGLYNMEGLERRSHTELVYQYMTLHIEWYV